MSKKMIELPCDKCIHIKVCSRKGAYSKDGECDFFDERKPQINIFCENADDKTKEELKADLKAILDEIRPQGEWQEAYDRGYADGTADEYHAIMDILNRCGVTVCMEDKQLLTIAEYVEKRYEELGFRKPQPKTGEWIDHGYSFYICNYCGMGNNNVGGCKTNFCPNCGADMRGEGQALEYQQMYISAIRHAIAKLQSSEERKNDG